MLDPRSHECSIYYHLKTKETKGRTSLYKTSVEIKHHTKLCFMDKVKNRDSWILEVVSGMEKPRKSKLRKLKTGYKKGLRIQISFLKGKFCTFQTTANYRAEN